MNRFISLPAIGLLFSLLLIQQVTKAQSYFTVDVKGKGRPMILIHGLYCNGEVWKETVERYSKDYECHVLTLAGFGGNQPRLSDNFLQAVTEDLVSYVKKEKLEKPVLLGHSMGAFISFWAASTSPQSFSKVIAIDGLPFLSVIQMPGATPESVKPMATNMRDMLANQTPDQIKVNQRMYLPSMITDPKRIEQVVEIAAKADNKTQGQVMYEMYTTDLRDKVAAIECPVMLMGAWVAYKQYGVTRESIEKSYSAQIKDIKDHRLEITDTGKHFIFYDEPEWFYEKVDSFLGK